MNNFVPWPYTKEKVYLIIHSATKMKFLFQNGFIGSKWSKMAWNGPKWSNMV